MQADFKLAPKVNVMGDYGPFRRKRTTHIRLRSLLNWQKGVYAPLLELLFWTRSWVRVIQAIAADASGKDWIGMELSNDYCKVARERIKAAKRLFRK